MCAKTTCMSLNDTMFIHTVFCQAFYWLENVNFTFVSYIIEILWISDIPSLVKTTTIFHRQKQKSVCFCMYMQIGWIGLMLKITTKILWFCWKNSFLCETWSKWNFQWSFCFRRLFNVLCLLLPNLSSSNLWTVVCPHDDDFSWQKRYLWKYFHQGMQFPAFISSPLSWKWKSLYFCVGMMMIWCMKVGGSFSLGL